MVDAGYLDAATADRLRNTPIRVRCGWTWGREPVFRRLGAGAGGGPGRADARRPAHIHDARPRPPGGGEAIGRGLKRGAGSGASQAAMVVGASMARSGPWSAASAMPRASSTGRPRRAASQAPRSSRSSMPQHSRWQPFNTISDVVITIDGWSRNFDGSDRGEMSLVEALSRSRNTTAVRLSETIGRKRVMFARRGCIPPASDPRRWGRGDDGAGDGGDLRDAGQWRAAGLPTGSRRSRTAPPSPIRRAAGRRWHSARARWPRWPPGSPS